MPLGHSKYIGRRKTVNTMAKNKRSRKEKQVRKTLKKTNLTLSKTWSRPKTDVIACIPEGLAVPPPLYLCFEILTLLKS